MSRSRAWAFLGALALVSRRLEDAPEDIFCVSEMMRVTHVRISLVWGVDHEPFNSLEVAGKKNRSPVESPRARELQNRLSGASQAVAWSRTGRLTPD